MSIKEILNDEKLTNQFIQDNYGLVIKVIQDRFPNIFRFHDFEDYVQEGLLAVYKAMQIFDEERGNAFSTVAYTLIYRKLCSILKRANNKITQYEGNKVISLDQKVGTEYSHVCKIDFISSKINVEEQVIGKMYVEELIKKLKSMFPSKKYEVILQDILNHVSRKEIAEKFNCSVQAIDVKISRIRKYMGKLVAA
jgi:RNA polymerase sporulation-specific sigma factor